MKVPGLGAKRAFKLVQHFKFFNENTIFDDLLKAAADNRIAELEGFGEKSQAEIAKSIQNYKNSSSKDARMPLPFAYSLSQQITEYLKQNKYVQRVETLGSLRRMVSTIGDVDLAVTISDDSKSKEVIEHFLLFPGKTKVEAKGENKASILLANGKRVDLRIAPEKSFGAMLQYFTGSKAHNIKLREYALKKGYSLSEYGIGNKSEKGNVGRSREFSTEDDFYKFLGMQTPPPEIREGNEEIKLAIEGKLPKLIETKDLKGDFHIHSNYDLKSSHDLGAQSPEEISEVAKSLGYEYFAVSDHNPSVSTHSHDQLVAIMKERHEFMKSRKTSMPFFVSIEIDITPDGSLAF
jgi:DNA polymerase (family 10)